MTILSNNAELIASKRYYFDEKEGWDNMSLRVGHNIAMAEKDSKYWGDIFSEQISEMYFIPGGRILRNAGRIRGSLFNCYVLPISDSIEEIGQFIKDALITWSEGGGVGVNLSFLRPSDTPIRGKGGESSGPLSFLDAINSAAETIKTGGQRRAAGMALMRVDHPDINKFIDAKIIDGTLNNFNLSVGLTEEFIEAVERQSSFDLVFNHKIFKTIDALELWEKIIRNAVKYGDPGILNYDKMRSNNSYYFAPVIGTNPCGEACLEAYGICDLGSIVLPKFVSNINTNWKKLEDTIRVAVRFLDNVIDVNKYILPEFKLSAENARRVGLGVMGFADYLFAKKIPYNSVKAVNEAEKITKFIRDIAYSESINLAKEKGAFAKFNHIDYCKSHFVRSLPVSLRTDIKQYGIRNVTLLAMAPTGTISLIPETTNGIEPLFARAYRRSDRIGERCYIHDIYKEILASGQTIPEWFIDTTDLSPNDHLEIQSAFQRNCDGAVSKTINMSAGVDEKFVSNIILQYIHDLKGTTIYVDGAKWKQILVPMSHSEALEQYKKEKGTYSVADIETTKCASGKCEI
jgi:ribonucleoside-diphosphate reductase alpha chain